MAIRWIAPTAVGAADGSSPADAATLDKLDAMMRAAGPGGEVRLLATRGDYRVTSTVSLSSGGAKGANVSISGTDERGAWRRAVIKSNRVEATRVRESGVSLGGSLFRLNAGANFTCWRALEFKDCKNAMVAAASIEWLVWGAASKKDTRVSGMLPLPAIDTPDYFARVQSLYDASATPTASLSGAVHLTNVYRGFDHASSVSIKGMEIHGGIWRQTARGFHRFRGASSGLWVQDVDADCGKVPAEDGYWSVGFELNDTARDAVFLRVRSNGTYDTNQARGYTNGDGFAAERGNTNLLFLRCVSDDNQDGGIDSKATRMTVIGHKAARNKRGLRMWGQADAFLVDVADNRDCQIWATKNTGKVRVFSGSAATSGTRPVFVADGSEAKLYVSRAVAVKRGNGPLTAGVVRFFDAGQVP